MLRGVDVSNISCYVKVENGARCRTVMKYDTWRSWKSHGNSSCGVALAMRHWLGGIPTYGIIGLGKGDEHPVYAPLEYSTFTFIAGAVPPGSEDSIVRRVIWLSRLAMSTADCDCFTLNFLQCPCSSFLWQRHFNLFILTLHYITLHITLTLPASFLSPHSRWTLITHAWE